MPVPGNARGVGTRQLEIGRTWSGLALSLRGGRHQERVLAFTSYYSAFNALFWGWSYVTGRDTGSERAKIDRLICDLDVNHIAALASPAAIDRLLVDHPTGLRSLNRRSETHPEGSTEIEQEANLLMRSASELERSRGLAKAIYVVRCNLVHGTKDFVQELGLVEILLPPLSKYVEAATDLLEQWESTH